MVDARPAGLARRRSGKARGQAHPGAGHKRASGERAQSNVEIGGVWGIVPDASWLAVKSKEAIDLPFCTVQPCQQPSIDDLTALRRSRPLEEQQTFARRRNDSRGAA